jgi:mannose-6-phosphate isomerase-like protein (cupin superfamily)
MKPLLTFAALLVTAVVTTVLMNAVDTASGVTYVDHAKVATALNTGGKMAVHSDVIVQGGHRTGPGQVEVHDTETDVLYIIDGEATFVTGGTMIGGKQTGPGQHLGTSIQGGETHHLSKGDVIVIPAGTPHWFKELTPPVTYYVVKSVKP